MKDRAVCVSMLRNSPAAIPSSRSLAPTSEASRFFFWRRASIFRSAAGVGPGFPDETAKARMIFSMELSIQRTRVMFFLSSLYWRIIRMDSRSFSPADPGPARIPAIRPRTSSK